MNEKQHEMILEKTHHSGVEEWYCPTCGRRFLMQWPPAHRMIILEAGEKDTRHSVHKANSHIASHQETEPDVIDPIAEFRLIPWIQWMEKVDFEGMWDENS